MPLLDLKDETKVKEYEDFILNSPYAKATQSLAWHKVKKNWEPYYI